MLTPMETLPGWPEAGEPTLLMYLFLFVGVPVALSAVFVLVGKAREWGRSPVGPSQTPPGELPAEAQDRHVAGRQAKQGQLVAAMTTVERTEPAIVAGDDASG